MRLIAQRRVRWPIAPEHQAVVLWGGWLLVGIGAGTLWKMSRHQRWLAIGLLLVAAGATFGLQVVTSQTFTTTNWRLLLAGILFVSGAGLFLTTAVQPQRRWLAPGFVAICAALLITPAVWSALTNLYASSNQSLPGAYSGQRQGPRDLRGVQIDQQLLSFLQQNTLGVRYLMAVPSAMQGADYVIATGRPVLYLGGFMGRDQVSTSEGLQQLIQQGELR